MTLVGTAVNVGEKRKIYPQVLKFSSGVLHKNLKLGFFFYERDKGEKRTCRACKANAFGH